MKNTEKWLKLKEASEYLGRTKNAIHQQAWYQMKKGNIVSKRVDGRKYFNVDRLYEKTSYASDEKKRRVEELYFEALELCGESEEELRKKLYDVFDGKVSNDAVRERLNDFTFATTRVADEMESAFLDVINALHFCEMKHEQI